MDVNLRWKEPSVQTTERSSDVELLKSAIILLGDARACPQHNICTTNLQTPACRCHKILYHKAHCCHFELLATFHRCLKWNKTSVWSCRSCLTSCWEQRGMANGSLRNMLPAASSTFLACDPTGPERATISWAATCQQSRPSAPRPNRAAASTRRSNCGSCPSEGLFQV